MRRIESNRTWGWGESSEEREARKARDEAVRRAIKAAEEISRDRAESTGSSGGNTPPPKDRGSRSDNDGCGVVFLAGLGGALVAGAVYGLIDRAAASEPQKPAETPPAAVAAPFPTEAPRGRRLVDLNGKITGFPGATEAQPSASSQTPLPRTRVRR